MRIALIETVLFSVPLCMLPGLNTGSWQRKLWYLYCSFCKRQLGLGYATHPFWDMHVGGQRNARTHTLSLKTQVPDAWISLHVSSSRHGKFKQSHRWCSAKMICQLVPRSDTPSSLLFPNGDWPRLRNLNSDIGLKMCPIYFPASSHSSESK